jgi:mannose-6-phosphate isomerase-like protein (cupin superfamily)
MKPIIFKQDLATEFATPEGCFIIETSNREDTDERLSIARARVKPGITSTLHYVDGEERYIIAEGKGRVEIGDLVPQEVAPGDVVLIPPGVRQRITNIGSVDLIFYCVCTPRFEPSAYHSLE